VAGTRSIASAALVAAALLAGCGGDTTTVISETTTTVASDTTSTESSSTTPATTTPGSTTTADSGGTAAAQSLKAFQSPTGNIACIATAKVVRCDIAERDWSPPPHPASCPDEVDFGQGIQLPSSGAAQFVCAGDTALNPSAPKLPYGSSSQVGTIACTSAESGISCSNASGGSFTISRQSYDLG
jgi:hypothetical protein